MKSKWEPGRGSLRSRRSRCMNGSQVQGARRRHLLRSAGARSSGDRPEERDVERRQSSRPHASEADRMLAMIRHRRAAQRGPGNTPHGRWLCAIALAMCCAVLRGHLSHPLAFGASRRRIPRRGRGTRGRQHGRPRNHDGRDPPCGELDRAGASLARLETGVRGELSPALRYQDGRRSAFWELPRGRARSRLGAARVLELRRFLGRVRLSGLWDRRAAARVQRKVALMLRYEPQEKDGSSRFDGKKPSRWSALRYKVLRARERGAAAIVFVTGPLQDEGKDRIRSFPEKRSVWRDRLTSSSIHRSRSSAWRR